MSRTILPRSGGCVAGPLVIVILVAVPGADSARNQGISLQFAAINAGAASTGDSGMLTAGSGFAGTAMSSNYTMHVGTPAIFRQIYQVGAGQSIALLATCMLGPSVGIQAGCNHADLDRDGDVDLVDFAILQRHVPD